MNAGGFCRDCARFGTNPGRCGRHCLCVIASASSSAAIALTAFGVTVSASPVDLFIAGALSVVLLGLGFALISRGTRRSARTHKELKQLRKDKAITATKAAADREDSGDVAKDSAADRTRKGADNDTSKSTVDAESKSTADSAGKGTEAPPSNGARTPGATP